MRHVHCVVHEDKNMNAVQFPTRIRHLCRMRAHFNCFYVSNFNTRSAGSVVVSASDWYAGGPGLMPRCNNPVMFDITTNRHRLTLLKCAAGGEMLCATNIGMPPTSTYPNVAQAAMPLYNGRTMCTEEVNTLVPVQTS